MDVANAKTRRDITLLTKALKELDVYPALILTYIAMHTVDNEATLSVRYMADGIGISTTTVQRWLTKLEADGWLVKEDFDSDISVFTVPDKTLQLCLKPKRKQPQVPEEILMVRKAIGYFPSKAQWQQVVNNLKGASQGQVNQYVAIWLAQGWNVGNMNWTRWHKDGIPTRLRDAGETQANVVPWDDEEETF